MFRVQRLIPLLAAVSAILSIPAWASEYGSGRDGHILISGYKEHAGGIALITEDIAGSEDRRTIHYKLERGDPFAVGDEVVIYAGTGDLAGKWETHRIEALSFDGEVGTMTLDHPVSLDFVRLRTRVNRVIEAESFQIDPGAWYNVPPGGPTLLAIKSRTAIRIEGVLSGSGRRGYSGPTSTVNYYDYGLGRGHSAQFAGGGGGGHVGQGDNGGDADCYQNFPPYAFAFFPGADGGVAYGSADLDRLISTGSIGGRSTNGFHTVGGWAIMLTAPSILNGGEIRASGETESYGSPSGGASGGSIWLRSATLSGSGVVRALGGGGGSPVSFSPLPGCNGDSGHGGSGAPGRIQINADYIDPNLETFAGTVNFQQGLFPNESVSWMMY